MRLSTQALVARRGPPPHTLVAPWPSSRLGPLPSTFPASHARLDPQKPAGSPLATRCVNCSRQALSPAVYCCDERICGPSRGPRGSEDEEAIRVETPGPLSLCRHQRNLGAIWAGDPRGGSLGHSRLACHQWNLGAIRGGASVPRDEPVLLRGCCPPEGVLRCRLSNLSS